MANAKAILGSDRPGEVISRNIYGHFSEHLGRCIYGGIFCGKGSDIPNIDGIRIDVIDALKEIKVPVLRWPGGCFADEYHWKDGIGPLDQRKTMVNTHWGKVTEDNSFGTHEFFRLCELLGCEPYINGNLGSGTVQEMQEWVEYITFDGVSPMAALRKKNGRKEPWRVKYWGVGNENWGCGGNMTPEHYADEYRRYQTYLRNFGDNTLFKIACGPNSEDYNWTEKVMQGIPRYMLKGLSLHYYTGPKGSSRSATDFTQEDYFLTLLEARRIEKIVSKHSAIMDKYDAEKEIALIVDEWGIWTDVEPGTNPGFLYQQNSMRDALIAATHFNTFNRHCDRVKMANIAQMVNVLQSVLLTEGDKLLKTPTYYIFKMYSVHQDARLLPLYIHSPMFSMAGKEMPAIEGSASMSEDGTINLTLCNFDCTAAHEVDLCLCGEGGTISSASVLTSERVNDCNTFDCPDRVSLKEFDGAAISGESLRVSMPRNSVAALRITK